MGILDRFKKTNPVSVPVSTPVVTPATQTVVTKPMTAMYSTKTVLLGPVITEKATQTGVYYFKVAGSATRNEVKKAIKQLYGKTPRRVNIMNVTGKVVRFGRSVGRRANWKKAIVYLAKGDTIDVIAK
ncbi:MAG: 50S ribosomal protein L23 [Candidatus Kerfeldbacteria bacterium]|nr:50S ribosomal protein L23 [Candidatus Kerfeldbacteria bacterium]